MKHRLLPAVLLTLCSSLATAGEVQVNLSIESANTAGDDFVAGAMTLEVINLSDNAISNVHLRPEFLGGLGLGSDVLQFGSLDPGESATTSERYHGDSSGSDPDAASTWTLDYDTAGGEHRQLTLRLEHE